MNSSGNAPSGTADLSSVNQGTTTGIANPPAKPLDGDLQNSANPPQGADDAGLNNPSGAGDGGPPHRNVPTTTREEASDAQIDSENRRADQKAKSVCKGC
ncbi:hypothetical protein [Bradyrhizobium lablabi]|uniref:hypothetical protein n=1 Tax=Bradyrhizobium lablabi TaxID=722472 RepID=UPI001BA86046|nr:hypothetical protein [Bradyrhizobium lablabi]MBR0695819.1 hypothetical protein [Bradyrhizobium lablabi]